MNDRFQGVQKKIIVVAIILLFSISLVIVAIDRLNLMVELERLFGVNENVVTLINNSTQWSYLEEGLNPSVGNVWTTEKYQPEQWKQNYGDFGNGIAKDVSTQLKLTKQDSKAIASYFFRYDFLVDEALYDSAQRIEGIIEYNDAAIIYLNGQLVFAGNVPENGYMTNQEYGASEKINDVRQDKFYISDLSALKKGENIIAVEIHQYNSTSEDIYFNFKELSILKTRQDMPDIDSDTLMIEVGDSEQDIDVSWITKDLGYYQVEYLEQTSYRSENAFDEQAQTVLMGRQAISNDNSFLHRVSIKRLKNDTEYAYRIRKIATDEMSEIKIFKTGKKAQFQAAIISDLTHIDEEMLANLVEEVDFLITPIDLEVSMDRQDDIMQAIYDWRKQSILKRIPTLPVQGDFENNQSLEKYFKELYQTHTMDSLGNRYLVYQDVLLIYLNNYTLENPTYAEFLTQTLDRYEEKRSVVIVQDEDALIKALDEYDLDYIIPMSQTNIIINFDYRTIDTSSINF